MEVWLAMEQIKNFGAMSEAVQSGEPGISIWRMGDHLGNDEYNRTQLLKQLFTRIVMLL